MSVPIVWRIKDQYQNTQERSHSKRTDPRKIPPIKNGQEQETRSCPFFRSGQYIYLYIHFICPRFNFVNFPPSKADGIAAAIFSTETLKNSIPDDICIMIDSDSYIIL